MNPDSTNSSYRERLLEHLLIGELLKRSWTTGRYIEISRPEVDRSGYDVIMERCSVVRHVQLKTRKSSGKAKKHNVHEGLAAKASGCVIVVLFDEDLRIGPFLFFGAGPGEALPSLEGFPAAKHPKLNSEGKKSLRLNLKVVGHREFRVIGSIEELITALFGP